ncbi:FecCD family ABC transporter permease [Pollutimonas bauzanensis]|uniref:Iron complex transport system permease protein n=1 Tax=Pollutimonas bauzanensis TaxID=658167 RepID=A0A1M5Y952_9BURK|nr:iron ABC transporter permease [Pollutimonas bauzanensis]SHI08368.1 iron complex transport system permease protein [Pollutimonas bauzanensis]
MTISTQPLCANPIGSAKARDGRRSPFILADLLILLLFVALLALMVFSLVLGRYPVPIPEIIKIVATTGFNETRPYTDKAWVVIEIVRMPRILGVTLCGMGLAMAGAAMQGVFRNPLVGPEVAGVSSGAAFGGVLAIMFSLPMAGVVGLAFGFGMGALAVAFGLSKLAGKSSILGLVLAGVIVGGFFGALTGMAQYVADPQAKLPSIVYWLLGSFVGLTYEKVAIVAGVTLFAGTLLLMLRWRINLLSLGEVDAEALGVKVETLRWCIVALVALLVAAQVSVSGGVNWVGLIIPHIARMLVGPEHTRLLPASALLGGIYLLAMDDIARSITAQEIPIGLLTALVGTPVFGFLFWKMHGKGWNRE